MKLLKYPVLSVLSGLVIGMVGGGIVILLAPLIGIPLSNPQKWVSLLGFSFFGLFAGLVNAINMSKWLKREIELRKPKD